jgi:uncharacterized membrane protein
MLRTDGAARKTSACDCHLRLARRIHSPRMTAVPATPLPGGPARPARRAEVDAVRGLVLIVMTLDHVRDFLGNAHFDATDLARTTAPLFFSRWITHFCAPTFFLLAGMSAYLSIQSGRRTTAGAARFLVVRGLALVVLEQTALRCLGWYFHFDYHYMNAGVLYGLGWSMVLLAALVVLPPAASLAAGLVIVLGEPAIAAIDLGDGPLGTLWALATRSRDFEPIAGYHFYVSYPPIPWFGVMALGHGLAALAYGGGAPHRKVLAGFAAAFLALFVVLRALNLGDPSPWSAQPSGLFTALSFVNLSKYPPSTPFLLLTLGGALLGLAALARAPGPSTPGPARWVLETLGRVPLFFYLLHIPLIHAIAVAYSYIAFGAATWLTSGPVIFWDVALPGSPPSYGFSLLGVYAIWIAVVAALVPLCRWYGARRPR